MMKMRKELERKLDVLVVYALMALIPVITYVCFGFTGILVLIIIALLFEIKKK